MRPTGRSITFRASGFTLIELLIVMVIIGIVTVILLGFFMGSYQRAQLRDGASQLVADLNRARSQAQRSSTDSVVTIAGTVGNPNSNYSTVWAIPGGTAPLNNQVLPAPIRVAPFNASYSSNTITYSAPYGEMGGTNAIIGILWEVSSTATSSKLYIKSVGVTGKVILSATSN